MNDKLDSRRVVIMPTSSDGLRGQQRDTAAKNEALVLRDAIRGALDIIDLFQHEGGIVLVANGEVRNVGSELLRWIIEATFVEKVVARKLLGSRHEVEYRPVNPSEQAVRALLRAEAKEGGLLGQLPVLRVEEPQLTAAPVTAPEAPKFEPHPVEQAAGARQVARYANAGARLELEKARGAEVVENYRQSRQVAVEAPVEESIPFHAPAETNDSAVDPADTRA
jgi:hypothetical protein